MIRFPVALALAAVVAACDGTVLTGPAARDAARRAQPMIGEAGFPLILVDGREISRPEVREIQSDLIERIEVVKGSAALRAYGERGRAGVILIALKPATPPTGR